MAIEVVSFPVEQHVYSLLISNISHTSNTSVFPLTPPSQSIPWLQETFGYVDTINFNLKDVSLMLVMLVVLHKHAKWPASILRPMSYIKRKWKVENVINILVNTLTMILGLAGKVNIFSNIILVNILKTIVGFYLVLMMVPCMVPFFLFFWSISFAVKLVYAAKFGSSVKKAEGMDSLWGMESKESRPFITACLLMAGVPDVKKIQSHIMTKVINQKDANGDYRFRKFRQVFTKECGYYCWRDVDTINIEDHIRVIDLRNKKDTTKIHSEQNGTAKLEHHSEQNGTDKLGHHNEQNGTTKIHSEQNGTAKLGHHIEQNGIAKRHPEQNGTAKLGHYIEQNGIAKRHPEQNGTTKPEHYIEQNGTVKLGHHTEQNGTPKRHPEQNGTTKLHHTEPNGTTKLHHIEQNGTAKLGHHLEQNGTAKRYFVQNGTAKIFPQQNGTAKLEHHTEQNGTNKLGYHIEQNGTIKIHSEQNSTAKLGHHIEQNGTAKLGHHLEQNGTAKRHPEQNGTTKPEHYIEQNGTVKLGHHLEQNGIAKRHPEQNGITISHPEQNGTTKLGHYTQQNGTTKLGHYTQQNGTTKLGHYTQQNGTTELGHYTQQNGTTELGHYTQQNGTTKLGHYTQQNGTTKLGHYTQQNGTTELGHYTPQNGTTKLGHYTQQNGTTELRHRYTENNSITKLENSPVDKNTAKLGYIQSIQEIYTEEYDSYTKISEKGDNQELCNAKKSDGEDYREKSDAEEGFVERSRVMDELVEELVSEESGDELSGDRPAWELVLLLRDDNRYNVVLRLHHAIGDGISFTRLCVEALVDTPLPPHPVGKRPLNAFFRWAMCVWSVLMLPWGIIQLMANFDRSSLHGPALSDKKIIIWSKGVSLQLVRDVKKITNTTVNDVLMSCLASALAKHFYRRGEKVDGVTAVVPVSFHDFNAPLKLTNNISIAAVKLPSSPTLTPLQRLNATKSLLDGVKRDPTLLAVFWLVRGMSQILPSYLATILLSGSGITMGASNVPGPQQDITVWGDAVEDLIFWVPNRAPVGAGVSFFSYAGRVNVGFMVDENLVNSKAEAQQLIEGVEEELNTLHRTLNITP